VLLCCGGCKRRTCGEQWSQRAAAQTRRATRCRDESALAPGFNHRYSNGTSVMSVVEFSDFDVHSCLLFPPHRVALQLQPSPQQRRGGTCGGRGSPCCSGSTAERPATQPHFGSKWMSCLSSKRHNTKRKRGAGLKQSRGTVAVSDIFRYGFRFESFSLLGMERKLRKVR
jgi:hypothetical protein